MSTDPRTRSLSETCAQRGAKRPLHTQGGSPNYLEKSLAAAAEPFRGITRDGNVIPGLYGIQRTGVSTQTICQAAKAFLGSLNAERTAATTPRTTSARSSPTPPQRHITVVPEIDIPGHSQAAIAAYPELGNTDVIDTTSLSVWDTWGINPNVLAPTDNTLRFYEGVFEELLGPVPASQFVHVGGDECPKDQWRRSPAAQARIGELGLAGRGRAAVAGSSGTSTRWLAARGRRLIGWDEILEGGLAPGAAVSSWRGYAGGIAAARAGHDVVMCPEQQVYLDHRQAAGPDEPVPIGYVRTLEDVYRFEPVPPELTAEEARHVLGAQANVWTEVMEDTARVDYQAFPAPGRLRRGRLERPARPAERDFAGFERRMSRPLRPARRPRRRLPAARRARVRGSGARRPRTADRRAAPERVTEGASGRACARPSGRPCSQLRVRPKSGNSHCTGDAGENGPSAPMRGRMPPSGPSRRVSREDVPELPRPGCQHVPYGSSGTAGTPGRGSWR